MLRLTPCPSGILASVTAAVAAAMLTGCGGSSSSSSTPTAPSPSNPFATTVFIGDSLTAGYQNGSLLDTQQPNGYGSLIAKQANFSITLPLIAPPGAPAVLELTSTGFPPGVQQVSGITTGRDNPTAQPTDLAVPGHKLHDLINAAPTVAPTGDEDIITDLVLGFPVGNTNTQLQEAIALTPSTLFVWIGNDDALQADESGDPTTMTSLASFTSDFTQLMTTLQLKSKANIFVANIPDVTAIPYMTPAVTVINEIASLTGQPAAAIGTALGLSTGDLVNASGLSDIEAELPSIDQGNAPTPLPGGDVLTVAEIATVQATINSYNQVIQQQATSVGATVVDMHTYFGTLAAGVSVDGTTATESFLGGLFGLDGIHPTNTGYALLANQFLAAVNTKLSLSTAMVNVNTIAAADPYFPPNIQPVAAMARIPTAAALRSDDLITGWKGRKR